ncbi:MAG: diguanylate cyclase [Proteobacteria bacterium]|nr:diguanylate cyclase [Pseudomonadota bacterium]
MRFPSSPRIARSAALLLLFLLGGAVELLHHAGRQWLVAGRHIQALTHGAAVRARIESEINAVLFLSSGLTSYLMSRHDSLDAGEVQSILGNLYGQSRHVRNLGIAVGLRLTYLYPLDGNQSAIGLDYRSQAEQWPLIERSIKTRQPSLAGPLALKQGGVGIIYRVPIYVGDRFWGLLSSVIDSASVFATAGLTGARDGYEYALRGKDGLGGKGSVFLGSNELFADPDAVTMEILVPGGSWLLAVKPEQGYRHFDNWLLVARLAGWGFSALLAYLALAWLRLHCRMAEMALYDTLTGLPNRNLLMDRLTQLIHRSERQNTPFSLLYIDLDGFKTINDTMGHKVGDFVLLEVATRLSGALRRSDTITRWGGDEFIALLGNTAKEAAMAIAENLRRTVDAPLAIGDRVVQVGASIGIAVYSADGDNATSLMRIADLRMYREKDRRKREQVAAPT